jgi:SAM-dependent methyltransferase
VNTSLRDVPCPVCEHTGFRVLYESTLGTSLPELGYKFTPKHVDTYRIVKCNSCGHTYCSPIATDLFAEYVEVEDSEYIRNEPQRLATAEKVTDTLLKYKSGGRLLDVGCSTGDFLRIARQHYDVEGVELSRWSAGVAKARGLRIHECRLSELPFDKCYDVITLWGVIEHLENPKVEIGNAYRLLKEGGILCIWTGNIDSSVARILGKKWWYFMGQHIQYFSANSLNNLMIKAGYEKVAMKHYPYVLSMASVANSIGRYPILSKVLSVFLKSPLLSSKTLTFALPGEMFAIYAKSAKT